MKKRKGFVKPEDKIRDALDLLCRDVQEHLLRAPIPEVLTWAIKGLFPEEILIPEGAVIEINTYGQKVTWLIKEPHVSVKINYWNAVWLRRRLSRYIM